jgi:hypothetical protein
LCPGFLSLSIGFDYICIKINTKEMKRLGTYFLQGLLLVAPLAATVYIVYFLFMLTDGLLSTYLEEYLNLKIPGLGNNLCKTC